MVQYVKKYGKALAAYGAQYAGRAAVRYVANKAGSYISKGASYAMRRRRKSMRSSRNSTTTQKDTATKFMATRSSRSFQRFRSKVRAALQADNPLCIYQSFLKGNATNSIGLVARFGFYIADTFTTNQADIFNIFKDAYGVATAADCAGYKIYLKSAVMDLQMRNPSATVDIWTDVYELECRSDRDTLNDPASDYLTEFLALQDIGSTDVGYPQVTPFQVPGFLRNWRVVRCKTFLIKRSDSVAMQVRRRYNRMINGADVEETGVKRKLTTAFLVLTKGAPGNSAAVSGLLTPSIDYSVQLSYNYQEVTGEQDKDTIGQSK